MSKQLGRLRSMIGFSLIIVLLGGAVRGAVLAGDLKDDDAVVGLRGTWQAIFRYPGFPDDYFSLMAFNADGTMTAVSVDGPRTSVSLGVWKRIRGRGNFAATYDGLFDVDSDGFYDKRFRDRLTLHLSDDDTFTATAASDSLTLDGTTLTGPPLEGITIRGTKMKVIRE